MNKEMIKRMAPKNMPKIKKTELIQEIYKLKVETNEIRKIINLIISKI